MTHQVLASKSAISPRPQCRSRSSREKRRAMRRKNERLAATLRQQTEDASKPDKVIRRTWRSSGVIGDDRSRHGGRVTGELRPVANLSLLACLEVHSKQVHAEPIQRNDSATFIRFLQGLLQAYPDRRLYIIAHNGSSHRSKE